MFLVSSFAAAHISTELSEIQFLMLELRSFLLRIDPDVNIDLRNIGNVVIIKGNTSTKAKRKDVY